MPAQVARRTEVVIQNSRSDISGFQSRISNLKSPAALRFLLAYHCLVLNQREEAVKPLNEVVELNPKDKLSEAMAKAIGQSLAPTQAEKPKVGSL
jgi:hypothetical protein